MATTLAPSRSQALRSRRSRRGCRNCKLRKVKCDETRPYCQSCRSFGVVCNFAADVPDLQLSAEAQPQWKVPGDGAVATRSTLRPPRPPLKLPIMTVVATDVSTTSIELDASSTRLLYWFRLWMASNWGVAMDNSMRLAHQHPFLMHAVLAAAGAYERKLTSPPDLPSTRTISEMSHFSHCTTLLGRKLRQPIQPQDRDALWATASLLSILVFLAFDGPSPEEAWPCKDQDSSYLDWLRASDAKWALWKLTDPLRPDSIFAHMADTYARLQVHSPSSGIEAVAPKLALLFGLDERSSAATSPYFDPVHAVSHFEDTVEGQSTLGKALAFLNRSSGPFKALIARKDPRALLLLALWYSHAGKLVWWVELRGRVECRAICMYLRRQPEVDPRLLELLPCK
ncbi:putative C6 finger domain protein [Thozetella sp. PMI_491]|nr:putative C6 finger domain protein [Thozetella sp. PMI_491]